MISSLTPVAISSRKNGQIMPNLEEYRGANQNGCMSAQESILNPHGDALKSIDEYKAKINSQIRPTH